MNLADTFSSSFQNIISHPLRSLLTLIAIVIGIFAVVLMFSSVYGIKTMINENMKEFGFDNSLLIFPGQFSRMRMSTRTSSAVTYTRTPRQTKPLDYDDYLALKQNVEHQYLYGVINTWFENTSFSNRERVQLTATNNDFFTSKNLVLRNGRNFSSFEFSKAIKVCILGSGLVQKYFSDRDMLGENITIGNNIYVVIGILEEKELGSGMFNFNAWERRRELNAAYIPLTTGIAHLKQDKSVDYLFIKTDSQEKYAELMTRTRQVLLANHNMAHNFSFQDIGAFVANISQELEEFMKKWNITLTTIASISLLVGGLGLFSTMLISIGERLLEIGIRKSVGASPASIFIHFLLESLLLSLLGAFIGIVLSTLAIKIVSVALKFSFPIVLEGIFLGVGFAIVIGILSGLYPALKAADINPIRAIYYNE